MTAFKGLGTYGNAVGIVTPADHKLAQAGLIVKSSANLIRPGLFWGGNANIVTGTAGMAYSVAAYTCVTQRSSTSGVVLGGNDGALSVSTTAAPGSNSRIDIVYHWHREFALDGVDSNPVIGVAQGTAAAVPTAPSLAAFPGAIELARITVPAGVTATNSGTTITQSAPWTATAGGSVPFRNSTELNAATLVAGTRGFLQTDYSEFVSTGGAWIGTATGNVQLDTTNSLQVPQLVQRGIGKIVGSGTASLTKAITFPEAFKTGTIPSVDVNYIGSRTAGAFNTSALTGSGIVWGSGTNLTATTMQAYLAQGGTFSGVNDYYFSWIAIGDRA